MKIHNRLDILRDIDKLVGLEFATTIDDKSAKCQYWQEGFVSVAQLQKYILFYKADINYIDLLGELETKCDE